MTISSLVITHTANLKGPNIIFKNTLLNFAEVLIKKITCVANSEVLFIYN